MKPMDKAEIYHSPILDELMQEISPEELERTEKRMLLAARIYDAIKAKGWKRKDFAEALGKTPSEITKWLSGTHNFTSDTLFDIERVLSIKLVKLDNRPHEVIKTYIYNVTSQAAQEPQGYWSSIIYNEGLKQSYKAKSQLNTAHSN
jgi:transcriptional regulator with XRE-family HTH domain